MYSLTRSMYQPRYLQSKFVSVITYVYSVFTCSIDVAFSPFVYMCVLRIYAAASVGYEC